MIILIPPPFPFLFFQNFKVFVQFGSKMINIKSLKGVLFNLSPELWKFQTLSLSYLQTFFCPLPLILMSMVSGKWGGCLYLQWVWVRQVMEFKAWFLIFLDRSFILRLVIIYLLVSHPPIVWAEKSPTVSHQQRHYKHQANSSHPSLSHTSSSPCDSQTYLATIPLTEGVTFS